MIGFLLLIIGIMMFMGLGYTLITAPFIVFMNTAIIICIAGIAITVFAGALWEFYFPQPAKMFIANKRVASYELAVDDIGWGELLPSKSYMPEGLVKWRYGWSLLPRPIMKFGETVQNLLAKKRGRPKKDPESEKQAQEQFEAQQQQLQDIKEKQDELAEQIGLKKCMLKGTGRPLWLQYVGAAANFNPYVLVPLEAKQDNPHNYFSQMQTWITGYGNLTAQAKAEVLTKLADLETHVDKERVVIDPRRFKEIHPQMYTESQLDALERIFFRLGQLSISGMPVGKIIMILLVVGVVVGGIAAVYFLFLKPQQPQGGEQQAASFIIHRILQRYGGLDRLC